MIQAGTYSAKVSDWGYVETKAGVPGFHIYFDIEGMGSVRWNGYLSEKGMENVFKTLATCGFTGGDLEKVADGKFGKALDTTKELQIVVEIEDYNGKSYPRVKWVNEPRAARFDQALAVQAKSKVSQVKANWISFKQNTPAATPAKKEPATPLEF